MNDTQTTSIILAEAFQELAEAIRAHLSSEAFAAAARKVEQGYQQAVAMRLVREGELLAEFLLIAPGDAEVIKLGSLAIHSVPTVFNS
jgi:hypothetical protein